MPSAFPALVTYANQQKNLLTSTNACDKDSAAESPIVRQSLHPVPGDKSEGTSMLPSALPHHVRAKIQNSLIQGASQVLLVTLVVLGITNAHAQDDCGGATVTPDGRILVNKEQGDSGQRWTIIATTIDGGGGALSIVTVSGNVSRRDGTPEQFLYCQPDSAADRPDNSLIRDDGEGEITLLCRAVEPSACERSGLTARDCLKVWPGESLPPVTLPKRFFLPRVIPCGPPEPPTAVPPDGRAVVTYDEREYLVNKAVQNERWTISLAKPATAGGFDEAPAIGNVFFPTGQDPLFVYCEPKQPVNVYRDSSEIDFRCLGASTCTGTLAECRSASRWPVVAESVPLGVSFFLPPGGSGQASTGCEYGNDPETLDIFRNANCQTDDQRCVACRAAAQGALNRVAQEPCGERENQPCTLPIEGCDAEIIGVLVEDAANECFCVGEIPDECLSCESLRLDAGERCELASTAGRTIVGKCQPRNASDAETFCLPPNFADNLACGGPAKLSCDPGTCCRSDEGDACGAAEVTCDGLCVAGDGGACTVFAAEQLCGDGDVDAGEGCDDGNKVGGDGCSATCTLEVCSPQATRPCQTGIPGVCQFGVQTCDATGGGFGQCVPQQQPGSEDCGNESDDDCDGTTDAQDSDCRQCEPGATRSCMTGQPGICSSGLQTCLDDGRGFGQCNPTESPRPEQCDNNLDDDCDGAADTADSNCLCQPLSTRSCGTGLSGACASGRQQCNAQGTAFGECAPINPAQPEQCTNGIDDDCDGSADAGDQDCFACEPFSTQACATGLPGVCSVGTEACESNGSGFGECIADVDPGELAEQCSNGLDDDCDGNTDASDSDCISSACDTPISCANLGGGLCSSVEACTPPTLPTGNVCVSVTEGESYCVPNTPCNNAPECTTSADCAANERCIVNTACDCPNANGPRRCYPIDLCTTGGNQILSTTSRRLGDFSGALWGGPGIVR